MISPSQLTQSRDTLKRIVVDAPQPALSTVLPTLCPDSETYHAMMDATCLERYVAQLGAHTPRSVFLPLSDNVLSALVDHAAASLSISALPPALAMLAENISEAMAIGIPDCPSLFAGGAFVRLSTRSPKDAALRHPLFAEHARAALASSLLGAPTERSRLEVDNARLIALYRASVSVMRVMTGADAVRLLLTSTRILGDLAEELRHRRHSDPEKPEGAIARSRLQLVVREFVNLDPTLEFRAFVHRGVVTAITQYNPFVFLAHVQAHKAAWEALLRGAISELLPLLDLRDCVLDLAVVGAPAHDAAGGRVVCIELNPLAEFAGEGLFSWVTDKAVLLGHAPVEFRVRASVHPGHMLDIADDWAALLTDDDFWTRREISGL